MNNLSFLTLLISIPAMHAMSSDISACDDLFNQPSIWNAQLQGPDHVSWFRQLYICAQKYPDRMEATIEQHFTEHPDAMATVLMMARAKGFTFTKTFLEKIDAHITDVIKMERHQAIQPHMCDLKSTMLVMLASKNYRSFYEK